MLVKFKPAILTLLLLATLLLAACGGPDSTPTTIPVPPTNTGGPGGEFAPTTTDVTDLLPANTLPTKTPSPKATPRPAITSAPGEKVLRVRVGSEPVTVDPQKMAFVGEVGFGQLVFEALLELDSSQQPVPAAAEKLEVSPDGLVYTATLQKGLTYSDGTPLTAHNFEYGWRRLFDPRVSGRDYASIAYVIKGAWDVSELKDVSDNAKVEALLDKIGVQALDDETLQFTLLQKAPYFPYLLALWVGWPTRQDMVEQGGDSWTEPGTYIGNGPFVLADWVPGGDAVFTANDLYRKGRPQLDRIDFRLLGDSHEALEKYRAGLIDVTNIAPEDLETIKNDPALQHEFLQVAGNCTYYLGFNVQKPPFDNLKIRQAFGRAFDRNDWIETIFRGVGEPAFSFIPPDRPGYAPDLRQPDFNPTEAKELLDGTVAAEYPEGLPPIKLTYIGSLRNEVRFEWIQQQIKLNLGIDVQLDPVDTTLYDSLISSPETMPQLFYLGWCQDYPDPQDWLSLVFRSDSTVINVGWKNDEFDRLTREADIELDPTRRQELYHAAHRILVDEMPVIFLYYNVSPMLIKSSISGMREAAQPDDALVPGFKNIVNIDIEQ